MKTTTAAANTNTPVKQATEFHLIFATCFVVFLMIAVIARLLPKQWRPWPKLEGYTSIIAEAKMAVHTFIPFAFMA